MDSMKLGSRMVPLVKEGWQRYVPEGLHGLVAGDVPIYLKLDMSKHTAYRRVQVHVEAAGGSDELDTSLCDGGTKEPTGFIAKGLDRELRYLRVDAASLEELLTSTSCSTPGFERHGLTRVRKYRVIGTDRRGRQVRDYQDVPVHDLRKVELERAILVDEKAFAAAIAAREQWVIKHQQDVPMPRLEEFQVSPGRITIADLYLDALDIEVLRKQAGELSEYVAYPFGNRAQVPGIYLMFQAAYLLNERNSMDGTPEQWLKAQAASRGDLFRYRSLATAAKFVPLVKDRAKGFGKRGALDTFGFDGWGDGSKYTFPYINEWFAFVLALADWWHDPARAALPLPITELAQKLLRANFAGHEVGHLVYLISGQCLTIADEPVLRQFFANLGKRWRRPFGLD